MNAIKSCAKEYCQLDAPIRELLRRGFSLRHMPQVAGIPKSNRRLVKPQIEVAFQLTSWNCVDQGLYDAFEVFDFESAARIVFDSLHNQIFPRYRVFIPRLKYKFDYYVDWPLRRRVGTVNISRWERMEGPAPWQSKREDNILELYAQPVNDFGDRSIPRLRVGGMTPDSAMVNWEFFAAPLRLLFREFAVERRAALEAKEARRAAIAAIELRTDTWYYPLAGSELPGYVYRVTGNDFVEYRERPGGPWSFDDHYRQLAWKLREGLFDKLVTAAPSDPVATGTAKEISTTSTSR